MGILEINEPMSQNVQKSNSGQDLSKIRPTDFRFSKTVYLNSYRDESGRGQVYLSVTINRKRTKIPLGIYVRPDHFSKKSKRILSSCKEANDYNLIIGQAEKKANDILVRHRLDDKPISASEFKSKYFSGPSTGNFIEFGLATIKKRSGELSAQTIRTQKGDFGKLTEFKSYIGFGDLDYQLIFDFNHWMSTHLLNKQNTRQKTLKTIRTYVRIALKQGYIAEDPFKDFKISVQKTQKVYLEPDEVKRLEGLYDSGELPTGLQNTLQCFLFCCFCGGVRVSDVKQLNQHNVKGNRLVYVPQKTRSKSTKMVEVPIIDRAKKYMNKEGMLVNSYTNQVMNRNLKRIANLANIDKKVTFHVSRHTFATLFINTGGSAEVLRPLMGHESLKSTMVYVSVTEQAKKEQISRMNNV
jgi:site-specific recombinase XerD